MVKNTHLKSIINHKTYIYLKSLEIPTDNCPSGNAMHFDRALNRTQASSFKQHFEVNSFP